MPVRIVYVFEVVYIHNEKAERLTLFYQPGKILHLSFPVEYRREVIGNGLNRGFWNIRNDKSVLFTHSRICPRRRPAIYFIACRHLVY